MKRAKDVEEFVRNAFSISGLSYEDYFAEWDENGKHIVPFCKNGTIKYNQLEKAAEILGVCTSDLLSMNHKRVFRWCEKYFYMQNIKFLEDTVKLSYRTQEYMEQVILTRIFTDDLYPKVNDKSYQRYDYQDVERRCMQMLRETNEYLPGTFHPGASIGRMYITTGHFTSFPEIKEMVLSYLAMIERAKYLFYTALTRELITDEVEEYNYLATVLGVRDRFMPKSRGNLYYEKIRACRDVFLEEFSEDFFDFVVLDKNNEFMPWVCREFVMDEKLVALYLAYFPETKLQMRRYAMSVEHFLCEFAWSDADDIHVELPEECNIEKLSKWINDMLLKEKFGGKTPTKVYVAKTEKELADNPLYAERLRTLAGPVADGGIPVKLNGIRFDENAIVEHLAKRWEALGGI